MAGVKGKSEGSCPNAGGKREGAGRKPKSGAAKSANGLKSKSANEAVSSVAVKLEPQPRGGALKRSKAMTAEIAERDMLQLLQEITLGRVDACNNQVRAAIAAAQYTHTKKGEGNKKDEGAARAKSAAAGKYGVRQGRASRCQINNGR